MRIKVISTFVLLALLSLDQFNVAAQQPSVVRYQGSGNSVSVSFAELGYDDSDMIGPYDITRKVFSVPPNWDLLPGGFIELDYDVILSGVDASILDKPGNAYAGLLTVSYNDQIIGDIRLDKTGSLKQRFELPETAIIPAREDGQHELSVRLIAQSDCLYDIRTLVVVKATSQFDLPFKITAPKLDLARLPAPFYLRNSLLPDRTVLVIPDAPASQELQAALNVRTGFGSMVGRAFDFQMATLGQMTKDLLTSSNLIFVGTPDDFPLLEDVTFPTPIVNEQFVRLPTEAVNDGVVELALSPWNANKVILLISGNSDEAVVKAATAVSSGNIFVYQNPTIVYVSDVQALSNALPLVEDFKLQDLGFENVTLQGIGVDQEEFSFNVSKEQIATKDGQITLVYYHSGLLDYSLSSLTVNLNDQAIASQPFAKESEQLTYLPIKIPPGLLRFGENRLVVSAAMQPDFDCDVSGFSDPWVTISNQTAIHLLATPITEVFLPTLLDLKFYPTMLMTRSDLGDLAFILSENDPSGWEVAGDLAYGLGEAANPIIPNIVAAYANNVPENVRAGYSLIFVGKASSLPLLADFNDSLPAPFDFQSNTANEPNMQIVYRLPPGVNVGYLELLTSPYNPESIVLVASGNSDEGVEMAGNTLIRDQLREKLAGQFAVTNGTQVVVSSSPSHFSIVGTLVPPSDQIITTPLPSGQPNPGFVQPIWLLPMLFASGVVVILIFVFVAIRSLSKNRSPEMETPEEVSTSRKAKE